MVGMVQSTMNYAAINFVDVDAIASVWVLRMAFATITSKLFKDLLQFQFKLMRAETEEKKWICARCDGM